MARLSTLRDDLVAAATVALVTIPQVMGFAAVAGLPPVAGLYAAVAMGLVGAALSGQPRLNIGPAVTTSTMVYAVLVSVAPGEAQRWPAVAATLTMFVAGFTLAAALLKVGQFVRFVSRSVLIGLTAGSAALIFGTQLAPSLGVEVERTAVLAQLLWRTVAAADQTQWTSVAVAAGTFLLVLVGARTPRFPMPFVALVLAGVAGAALERAGPGLAVATIGRIPRHLPGLPELADPFRTDLIFGAGAIALVGIIQTLAIAKALAAKRREPIDARRELVALAAANAASGLVHGFAGAASFARSALNELAGARTRLSGIAMALLVGVLVAVAGPLAEHIPQAAIAGLLLATAVSMVDWRELGEVLVRDRYDRLVLLTTLLGVFVVPIHWAILLGLAVSIAIFLRRVSRLHLMEMVRGPERHFLEQPLDERTGLSPVTMLQVEGPLFFAHAEELEARLRPIIARRPRAIILRMRRTQQIDFSVIATLQEVAEEYMAAGGTLVICGLTPRMRRLLLGSALGRTIPPEHLLETTRKVFGSAHRAIQFVREHVGAGMPDEELFRRA